MAAQFDLPGRPPPRIRMTASRCAHVAELADALDSGFHFCHFQGVASRFNNCEFTIGFIG